MTDIITCLHFTDEETETHRSNFPPITELINGRAGVPTQPDTTHTS